MSEAADKSRIRNSALSLTGLTIGLIALVAAVMSPWIVDALEPEPQRVSLGEQAATIAADIQLRMQRGAEAEPEASPPEARAMSWAKVVPASVVGGGAFAMCLGVVGFVRREDTRAAGATVTIGLTAIVLQYFLLIAGLLILILLVAVILGALGVELPSP